MRYIAQDGSTRNWNGPEACRKRACPESTTIEFWMHSMQWVVTHGEGPRAQEQALFIDMLDMRNHDHVQGTNIRCVEEWAERLHEWQENGPAARYLREKTEEN